MRAAISYLYEDFLVANRRYAWARKRRADREDLGHHGQLVRAARNSFKDAGGYSALRLTDRLNRKAAASIAKARLLNDERLGVCLCPNCARRITVKETN